MHSYGFEMDEEFKGHGELNTRFSSKCPNSLVTLVLRSLNLHRTNVPWVQIPAPHMGWTRAHKQFLTSYSNDSFLVSWTHSFASRESQEGKKK
jgi:hypothetical protein